MKSSTWYRIAAVLLVLFAAGHTIGFSQPPDPKWGIDGVVSSMRSIHFDMQGLDRTYWDFYMAAGLCVGAFYVFSAMLAWQLGGLPTATLSVMRATAWAFALCFAVITALSVKYLFIIPIGFSGAITVCLSAAAWRSASQASPSPTRP